MDLSKHSPQIDTTLISPPKFSRMNSTKSELSDKEMMDSGRIDSGFMSGSNIDSDFISTSSLLSEDNPSNDLPHDKQTFVHSHFDSGVDIDLSEQFSEIKLEPSTDSKTESWKVYYAQDEDGDTQLHIAVLEKSLNTLHNLVLLAPSPVCLDIRNDVCQTALHLSVLTNQPHVTRYFILCNANYRKCDRNVRTPLHWAVASSFVECVRALTDPITSDEISQIKGLKFEKRTSLRNETINNTDCEGLSCIHLAASEGNVEIMRLLIANGGNVNAKEWKSGMTALHIAVEKRDIAMVQFLLSDQVSCIDIEATTFAGFTPYQICYDKTISCLLLESGAENLPHADDENDMILDSDEEDEEEVNDSFSHNYQEMIRT